MKGVALWKEIRVLLKFPPSFLSSDHLPHPLPRHPSLFFSSLLLLPCFLLFLLLFFISSPIELCTIGNVRLLLAAVNFSHGGLMSVA